MRLDDKDLAIIGELKENSRASIRDIAKRTKLRPSTVHQRIDKLKKNNVIEKFTLKLNNQLVGENFIVFIYLTTRKDIEPSFFRNHHVKEAFGITGEYDLLLKLKFDGIEEFNDYIISLRKNDKIVKTLSTIATITLKEEI